MTQLSEEPHPVIGNKLIIASHNAGKVIEIAELVEPLGIAALSAKDIGCDEPEETGVTFAENAIIKSENAKKQTNLPALADDSGLVIPALDGQPGIYSARWAGPGKDFTVAFDRIRKELGDKPADAHFVCALSLSLPDKEPEVFEGKVFGRLTFPPQGDHGFGYDPIFIPKGYDQTFAELDKKVKNVISHRAHAFQQFLAFLG